MNMAASKATAGLQAKGCGVPTFHNPPAFTLSLVWSGYRDRLANLWVCEDNELPVGEDIYSSSETDTRNSAISSSFQYRKRYPSVPFLVSKALLAIYFFCTFQSGSKTNWRVQNG